MKPEHFIYKSDGLYYIKYMPEYPSDRRDICGMIDPVYLADIHQKALERAKEEAVKVEWAGCETIARLILLKYGETKEGEIYTINMEEKIEVITACDCEISRLQGTPRMCFMCSGKRNIARIAAPKKEEESEDEFIAYIESLKNQSFEGWNEHAVSGYTTALLSLYQKYVEIKRKPL